MPTPAPSSPTLPTTRAVLALALAAVAVLTSSACSSSSAPATAPTSSQASAQTSAQTGGASPAPPSGSQASSAATETAAAGASLSADPSGTSSAPRSAGDPGGRTTAPAATTLTLPPGARLPALTWPSNATAGTVAAAFATATWQMDTATDTSPAQAQRRAAQLATPSFADTLAQAPATSGGAAWNELAARHGWTTASAQAQASPDAPDTSTKAYRVVTVTITAHTPDGWSSTTLFAPVVTYIQLFSDGVSSWRVNGATTSMS